MSTRIRTFRISDGDAAHRDEATVSDFLRSVNADRIDTAYDGGGWRILVLYSDTRAEEESAQIESTVAGELRGWRAEVARNLGVKPAMVMSDDAVTRVARYVPTTVIELRTVLNAGAVPGDPSPALDNRFENEIVQIVRQTLDSLV
ncbi:HRDC domain-containing protein [Fodinicurvata sp. EGI_FJ10296]|uniref:HRDC domain-containing protein n=1 Tax=Fodinicurvata sp. EGI_FJ10296 TaxID=3231908 RepID=UPI0034536538